MGKVSPFDVLTKSVSLFNQKDVLGYAQMYSENCILHGYPPDLPSGRQGIAIFYTSFLESFPDGHLQIEEIISLDDRLACRYVFMGTHEANFLGIEATGKSISLTGITMMHFMDGKCVERWNSPDLFDVLQQLSD